MSEQILASFITSNRVDHTGVVMGKKLVEAEIDFDDFESLLRRYEREIDEGKKNGFSRIMDDDMRIPVIYPELEFGCGQMGAIFGGKIHAVKDGVHTYTFNDPVLEDWSQIDKLKFDRENRWVKRILNCLKFFVENGGRRYAIQLFNVYEGADFIVSIRGSTQAFYDLIDEPPELRRLYELGYKAGVELYKMRKKIVKKYNESVFDHQDFSDLSCFHGVPLLDMDAYALCSPKVFEKIGFEYKQKLLNDLKGAKFHIHGAGYKIVPIAGHLENLTEIFLFDDPTSPKAFPQRLELRKQTFDIPLEMFCKFKDFKKALEEKSLPGGIKYNVFLENGPVEIENLNSLMTEVRKYRTTELSAKAKK